VSCCLLRGNTGVCCLGFVKWRKRRKRKRTRRRSETRGVLVVWVKEGGKVRLLWLGAGNVGRGLGEAVGCVGLALAN
jgi:hypothetical protein